MLPNQMLSLSLSVLKIAESKVPVLMSSIGHFLKLKKIVFILFIRERQSMTIEGQRERATQSLKQSPGSEPSAQSPTWGLISHQL